jgi:two-component system NtrC family response regulator
MELFLSVGLDADIKNKLTSLAESTGRSIVHCSTHDRCLEALGGENCAVVFYALPPERKDSWHLTRGLVHLPGAPDILAVIEEGATEAAEYAIQSGSWDIIYLPYAADVVTTSIERCLAHRSAQKGQRGLEHIKRTGIIGSSPLLERCLRQMIAVARSDSSVLILGETGTGKELFARAVHENSPRAANPLIVVDCTNLPGSLAESILFGHARGSFTGAVETTEGLFKQADKGTIFLDEIGELDLNIQKSLLRVIQERRFRPLSAKKEVDCDFRIIAATNRDLEDMVREGKFRQDLYHRINTRTIVLPSLRERKEDIRQLAEHYARIFYKSLNCPPKEIMAETLAALSLYPWPGNIRELANAIYATILNGIAGQKLYPQHLPEEIRLFLARSKITSQDLLNNIHAQNKQNLQRRDAGFEDGAGAAPPAEGKAGGLIPSFAGRNNVLPTWKQARDEMVNKLECAYLQELIRRCQGNFNTAQKFSGLSRARLYELLQKHSLSV